MSRPFFFRSDIIPVEVRSSTGTNACYGKHTHDEFSVGSVDSGESEYFNANQNLKIKTGSLVIVNPHTVHSCNPLPSTKWSYKMLYICPTWLMKLQSEVMGVELTSFIPFHINHSRDPSLFDDFQSLTLTIVENSSHSEVAQASTSFFTRLFLSSNTQGTTKDSVRDNLLVAYNYIKSNYRENISVKDVAAVCNLTEPHLISSFRQAYGITPHALQIALRINDAKSMLKQGEDIASVATDLGFSDQSHFHRNFKKLVAATPAQYKS